MPPMLMTRSSVLNVELCCAFAFIDVLHLCWSALWPGASAVHSGLHPQQMFYRLQTGGGTRQQGAMMENKSLLFSLFRTQGVSLTMNQSQRCVLSKMINNSFYIVLFLRFYNITQTGDIDLEAFHKMLKSFKVFKRD